MRISIYKESSLYGMTPFCFETSNLFPDQHLIETIRNAQTSQFTGKRVQTLQSFVVHLSRPLYLGFKSYPLSMKRFFLAVAKLILGGLILLVGIVAFFAIRNQVFLGGVNDDVVAYVQAHKTSLEKETLGLDAQVSFFNEDFYNNQVFLLGENHGYADVQRIDLYLLKHLNHKLGIHYYLAEMDTTRATKLNTFLSAENKDSVLLKEVVREIGLRIPQQSSKELFEKWWAIYDYNKTLPDSLRIEVLGLDQDFHDTTSIVSRDSSMLVNFENIVKTRGLQTEKFYGYFGYTHVLQSGFGEANVTPFAAKLASAHLPYAERIRSLVCLTLDSEMRMPDTGSYPVPPDEKVSGFNADGPFVAVKGIKDLKAASEANTITLFDLDAEGSPYRQNQRLSTIYVNLFGDDIAPNRTTQNTTDFYQFVFLIRNSRALTRPI